MIKLNDNFLKLQKSYLFVTVAQKVAAFKDAHPEARVISLGIGDVTQPLAPAVIEAMHRAVDEMADEKTFRGYGPEHGYAFLRQAIIKGDFQPRGIDLKENEIFVNDGAKSDTGNIGDILSLHNTIGVTDPIYPVYIDSNVMCGRAGDLTDGKFSNIHYMPCTAENHFVAAIPDKPVDIIYLCYPNNPTGTVITRPQLKKWVDYARENGSLIMYDAAYEAYIRDPEIPHSIYEIEGAKECAIEFHSFSKTAGFTGVRCGYTVVPEAVKALAANGERMELNPLWERRQSTKFNGTSYITQRGAEAVYSEKGRKQVKETIDYYMENARIMLEALHEIGLETYGGQNAPYIWLKTPNGMSSWDMFDHLLSSTHLVCTPGVGFGPSGEGYVRLTTFGRRQDCLEAMDRIRKQL